MVRRDELDNLRDLLGVGLAVVDVFARAVLFDNHLGGSEENSLAVGRQVFRKLPCDVDRPLGAVGLDDLDGAGDILEGLLEALAVELGLDVIDLGVGESRRPRGGSAGRNPRQWRVAQRPPRSCRARWRQGPPGSPRWHRGHWARRWRRWPGRRSSGRRRSVRAARPAHRRRACRALGCYLRGSDRCRRLPPSRRDCRAGSHRLGRGSRRRENRRGRRPARETDYRPRCRHPARPWNRWRRLGFQKALSVAPSVVPRSRRAGLGRVSRGWGLRWGPRRLPVRRLCQVR